MIFDCGIPRSHLRTFRDVFTVKPPWLWHLTPRNIHLVLVRMHRRVRRLVADLNRAIATHPNPPTMEQIMARIAAEPKPEPLPVPETIGERRRALGRWGDPEYADHPIDCTGCRAGYHDPIPAPFDHTLAPTRQRSLNPGRHP